MQHKCGCCSRPINICGQLRRVYIYGVIYRWCKECRKENFVIGQRTSFKNKDWRGIDEKNEKSAVQ